MRDCSKHQQPTGDSGWRRTARRYIRTARQLVRKWYVVYDERVKLVKKMKLTKMDQVVTEPEILDIQRNSSVVRKKNRHLI